MVAYGNHMNKVVWDAERVESHGKLRHEGTIHSREREVRRPSH